MNLETIYRLAYEKGMKEDLRPAKAVKDALKRAGKDKRAAKGADKAAFDEASLRNPYADTRILNGSGKEEIKTVMVGIDIDVAEILLADRLREKGVPIDLVISHHPSGRAYANLHKVMDIQPKLWEKYGLDEDVAQGIMKDRIAQVGRGVALANHHRASDAARLLGIPMMCVHTPADNCVASFLQRLCDRRKPKKLKNVLALLKGLPEYRKGMVDGAGPNILIGKENSNAGKIFVDMTGGTSGPDKMFPRLAQAGVKTIIGMHCKESGFKVASSEFINYVIAGHISSDNVGMNILFDAVEKKGKLNFIECSGFKRVRRK